MSILSAAIRRCVRWKDRVVLMISTRANHTFEWPLILEASEISLIWQRPKQGRHKSLSSSEPASMKAATLSHENDPMNMAKYVSKTGQVSSPTPSEVLQKHLPVCTVPKLRPCNAHGCLAYAAFDSSVLFCVVVKMQGPRRQILQWGFSRPTKLGGRVE